MDRTESEKHERGEKERGREGANLEGDGSSGYSEGDRWLGAAAAPTGVEADAVAVEKISGGGSGC